MQQLFVQFSDATESVVIAVIGGKGDPEDYPYQGVISSGDERYADFFATLTRYAQDNSGLPKPTGEG